jgi:2-dehydropantoate 2-reductase
MRICIFGAGAIGGLFAVKFALAGEDVTVIDRGSHLAAIEAEGLKLESYNGPAKAFKVNATPNAVHAGKQDLVVLAVKSHHLDQIAADICYLLDTDTTIVTVQNGLPWWYFQKLRGAYEGQTLRVLDPLGILADRIAVDRIVGCVAYPAAILRAPGLIRHVSGDRVSVGELDGSETERVKRLHRLFVKAGFKSRVLTDIRTEIWFKAWGTLAFNPISALTHATLQELCKFPETRRLAATMMQEGQAISAKLGIPFRTSMIEKRIDGALNVGAHKTSMLQDVEAGRSLEIEAIVGSILEVAELTQTSAPTIETLYALVKLLNNQIITRA